ncbi:TetR/AcrR family transcriptional regulator [Kineococcus sp. SYSU DK003]|uniref:TetR/AcrR family transcriptional regulator n=1 Tax=Kineococcus sp. SYSU DK003 TaxID=3383124 RepID=UPI003D7D32B7
MTSRRPGQRAGVARADVLAAARAITAEQGYPALSMRSVARRLGVAPNTLYSHVGSRADLLDVLLDDVLAQVPEPTAGLGPAEALRAVLTGTYAVLLAHRDLVPLYLERSGARGPHAVRLGELMTAQLLAAGVGRDDVADAVRVLVVHTIGVAAFAAPAPGDRPLDDAAVERSFRVGLDWLLRGILS